MPTCAFAAIRHQMSGIRIVLIPDPCLLISEMLGDSAPPVTFKSRATLGSTSSSRCQTPCAPFDKGSRARRLSFSRTSFCSAAPAFAEASAGNLRGRSLVHQPKRPLAAKVGGARRDRTDDLLLAKQALSQLSYGPLRKRRSDDRGQKRISPTSVI